jgi:hypothetical protein
MFSFTFCCLSALFKISAVLIRDGVHFGGILYMYRFSIQIPIVSIGKLDATPVSDTF